mmetsp:Transcript_30935/g.56067  ORF Transcript_30935/g.56067 Transcript_30935/m.56067 type:complete len:162 (+) Transcript_30935:73-558(+)
MKIKECGIRNSHPTNSDGCCSNWSVVCHYNYFIIYTPQLTPQRRQLLPSTSSPSRHCGNSTSRLTATGEEEKLVNTRPSAPCQATAWFDNTMAAAASVCQDEALQVTQQVGDFTIDLVIGLGDEENVSGREQHPDGNANEGDDHTAAAMAAGQLGTQVLRT